MAGWAWACWSGRVVRSRSAATVPRCACARPWAWSTPATAEVVAAIAEALEDPAGWQGDGIVSPRWVALRCGVTSSRARRLVAMARALAELPAAAAA